MVPSSRVRAMNRAPVAPKGAFVLYWMVAARRTRHNAALERAVDLAAELRLPLVVLEALRVGYRWASDRLHRFALDGMADNAAKLAQKPALYYPYVEPEAGAGSGLVQTLAARAAAVVTDDYPAFFLPRMLAAFASRCPVQLEAIDGNGIYPMRATPRVFTTAASFRRHLQKEIAGHLEERPRADPFARVELPRLRALPADVVARWPPASPSLLAGDARELAALPIDHGVGIAPRRGGSGAGTRALTTFVRDRLDRYATARNEVEESAASGLSPYLHWGHLSADEVLARLVEGTGWSIDALGRTAHGRREGFWNVGPAADAFLDELVTWRELGFNMCSHRDDYESFASLPAFARETLAKHAGDPRPHVYTLRELEQADTHDELWNAAQRELVRDGRMHNYLRMLWGKKVLEWSPTPDGALSSLIELNNKYALDGRDPSSYSGIFWVFGRYDRAWGPERPIFGKIRYMSSANTRRKLALDAYLERYKAG